MTANPDTLPDSLVSARKFLETTPRARLLGYLDIATRDVPEAAIAFAMTEIGRAMMDRTMTPQEAAIALLYAANPGKNSLVIRDIACNLAAAERIQASVDQSKGGEPTNDAPPVDPASSKKPKKAKKGGSLKADTSWLKKIGTNGIRWPVPKLDESALWAADRLADLVSGYRKEPRVRDQPVYQFGRLPGLSDAILDGGDDGPMACLALVQHSKKGCPKNAIRERAIRDAATGPVPMSPAEMEGHLLDEWYAHAIAEIDVFPIVWAPKIGEILVSVTGKARNGFVELASAIPEWKHSPAPPTEVPTVPATELRRAAPPEDERERAMLDLNADLRLWLLWLCQVRGNGTWWESTHPTCRDEGWRVWIDDECEITVRTSGAEKKVVTLKNATADHGALVAALADGGVITKLRIGLMHTLTMGPGNEAKRPKKYFHVTLAGSGCKSVGLPCVTGVRDGLGRAIAERMRLLRDLDGIQSTLAGRFKDARVGEWDRVVSRMREWIGTEVARRWKYDPKSGQGFLFDAGN